MATGFGDECCYRVKVTQQCSRTSRLPGMGRCVVVWRRRMRDCTTLITELVRNRYSGVGLAALLLVAAVLPASALEVCPSVGKVQMPVGKVEPCEGLAYLAKIISKCAAEIPED